MNKIPESDKNLLNEIISVNSLPIKRLFDRINLTIIKKVENWSLLQLLNSEEKSIILLLKTFFSLQICKNFSNIFKQTIERYALLLKIERTKELIEMGKLNFTQIAYLLGYSNLSGLSRQFKNETGCTMKMYKEKMGVRTPLDKIR